MEYLSTEKILIVDLGSGEINEEELSDELVQERIGGAGITKYLFEQYQDEDPLVIGTGVLTGTLCPASAAGVMTAKSPRTMELGHVPFAQKVAIELKYAGFDYLVVKGVSEKPVFLWLHDGVADLNDAGDVWGQNTWQTTDYWRQELGEDLIQTLVIGEAGETGSDFAQVILNYWGSGDRFGFGKLFGQKKLKGIALRGMGLLEIADPETFVEKSLDLLTQIKQGHDLTKSGIGDLCEAIGEEAVKDWLAPVIHRHTACYNTPLATNTFVFLDEDPARIKETQTAEPGFLLTDLTPLPGLKRMGLSVEQACGFLRDCAKYGIDAASAVAINEQSGKTSLEDLKGSLPGLSGEVELPGKGLFSSCCPPRPISGDFGLGADAQEHTQWWERRQGVASVFGVHPVFAVMSPELSEESLLELLQVGTELEIGQDRLDAVVSSL